MSGFSSISKVDREGNYLSSRVAKLLDLRLSRLRLGSRLKLTDERWLLLRSSI